MSDIEHFNLFPDSSSSTRHGWRATVWRFLNPTAESSRVARAYELLSAGLSLMTIVADMVGSMQDTDPFEQWPDIFYIDVLPFCIFSVEYVLRVWASMECSKYTDSGEFLGRLQYVIGPMQIVDLVVVVALAWDMLHVFSAGERPEYVVGFPAVRIFRLLRVLALLKFERHTNSIRVILSVIVLKQRELCATLFTAAILMTVSAITMYHLEYDAQPDAFPNIPAAMWWSTTALTTVGYGDIYPITVPGKIVASIVAFFGVGLFALPAGILGSGFVEVFDEGSRELLQVAAEKAAEEEEHLAARVETLAGVVDSLSECMVELRGNQCTMMRQQTDMAQQQRTILELLRADGSSDAVADSNGACAPLRARRRLEDS